MKNINSQHLVPMDIFQEDYPVIVDLVYADGNHPENIFGSLYHPDSLMWVHKNIAKTILLGSIRANESFKWVMRLCDALRPVEVQELMQQRAKIHPLLLSRPGGGAHPRGLAIDIQPQMYDGSKIDMGTSFDHFADDPERDNPAARDYKNFDNEILHNRRRLQDSIVRSGEDLNLPIWPLSQEWWDFRYPLEEVQKYAPFYEQDLLPCQRMLHPEKEEIEKIRARVFSPWLQSAIDEVCKTVDEACRYERKNRSEIS